MNRPSILALIPAAALMFGSCTTQHTGLSKESLTGHVTLAYSASNPAVYGNGKVTLTVNASHGTKWAIYKGSTPPSDANVTNLPNAVISANYLLSPYHSRIIADVSCNQPDVPVYYGKLTTLVVNFY